MNEVFFAVFTDHIFQDKFCYLSYFCFKIVKYCGAVVGFLMFINVGENNGEFWSCYELRIFDTLHVKLFYLPQNKKEVILFCLL